MISNPEKYIEKFARAGADIINFHLEATDSPLKIIEQIRKTGKKCGITINPDTPMEKLFKEAFSHKGLSVVEIITGCPTGFGRKNNQKTPASMLLWQKEHTVNKKMAENMSAEELEGKFITGILHHDTSKDEYVENYDKVTGFTLEHGGK